MGVASLWVMIEFLGAAAMTQEPVQLEGRSEVGRDQEVDEHSGGDTVMGGMAGGALCRNHSERLRCPPRQRRLLSPASERKTVYIS